VTDRYDRQKDLVPGQRLADCKITVIGVGAIGRQVALQLAAMGAQYIQLVDHDHVEETNISSQAYYESDLNKQKVDATGDLCNSINKDARVIRMNNRFRRSQNFGNIVFCCVDKIETRKLIWETVKDKVEFFVDGRMSGEVLRVIAAMSSDPLSQEHYATTLFTAEEAHTGSCTAKSTIYCANIAAGMMMSKFAMWLRHLPIDYDMMLNLLSSELIVQEQAFEVE